MKNKNLYEILLEENRIEPTWENLFYLYDSGDINSDLLTQFISDQSEGFLEFGKSDVPKDDERLDDIIYYNAELASDNFLEFAKFLSREFDEIPPDLPEDRILPLSELGLLQFGEPLFESLKERGLDEDLHFLIIEESFKHKRDKNYKDVELWLEHNDGYSKVINSVYMQLSAEDLRWLLQKNLTENWEVEDAGKIVVKLLDKQASLPELDAENLFAILSTSALNDHKKIEVFNQVVTKNNLEKDMGDRFEEIDEMIESFKNGKLKQISRQSTKRPLLTKGKKLEVFLRILEELDYISSFSEEEDNTYRIYKRAN